jgi:uncharacterized protein
MVKSSKIKSLVTELKTALRGIYASRLKAVLLFGSYARGEQSSDSDVDILIVLDEIANYCAEVDRTGRLGEELSLKYGVSISKVFVRESDWHDRETPFLMNVRKEAVPA